jgi:hypothetical protein
MTPEQLAASSLNAAWSARNAAWWGVVIAGVGAAVNSLVLVLLTVVTTRGSRKSRAALNRLAAKQTVAVFGLVDSLDKSLGGVDDFAKLTPDQVRTLSNLGRAFNAARPILENAAIGVDDADLQEVVHLAMGHLSILAAFGGSGEQPTLEDLAIIKRWVGNAIDPETAKHVERVRRKYGLGDAYGPASPPA